MEQNLTVRIVVANPTQETIDSINNQSYKSDICLVSGDNISDAYNEKFVSSPKFDIYGFLSGNDKLLDDCIRKIVDAFKEDMELVGVVYPDKYLLKGNNLVHQIYPPYVSDSEIVYNPTIFVNGRIEAKIFDPKLNHLRAYDTICKIGKATKIVHIPEILIESKFTHNNVKDELEYVRQSN